MKRCRMTVWMLMAAMVVYTGAASATVMIESTNFDAGDSSISGHSTTADTDALVVGWAIMRDSNRETNVMEVSFDGTAMTNIASSFSEDGRLLSQFFVLLNPGVVTGNIVGNTGDIGAFDENGRFGRSMVAYNIKGLTDLSQLSAVGISPLTGDISSVDASIITTEAGLLIDLLSSDDADSHTAQNADATVLSNDGGDKGQSSSYLTIATGGNYTMGYNFGSTVTDGEGAAYSLLAIEQLPPPAVPEPATVGLALLAMGGLVARRRRA